MSQIRTATNSPCDSQSQPINQCINSASCTGLGTPDPPLTCSDKNLGYTECVKGQCQVAGQVWYNSCTGYHYVNSQPSSSPDCATCSYCSPGSGGCPSSSTTTPLPSSDPIPSGSTNAQQCDPITLTLNPSTVPAGTPITVSASSVYGYTDIVFNLGGGAALYTGNVCNGPSANCAVSPFTWSQQAIALFTPGTYTATYTGNKVSLICTEKTTYTVGPLTNCPSPLNLNVNPNSVAPGAQVSYITSSIAPYTNVKLIFDNNVANPVTAGMVCSPCTAPTYTWTWTAAAPSNVGTHTVRFASDQCTSADASFTVTTTPSTTSSKTKDVATALLNYASANSISSYILFCDKYDKAVNYYKYISQGTDVENILKSDSASNFCVLKYGSDTNPTVISGVEVNNLATTNLLKVLGESSCNLAGLSTTFRECSAAKKAWVNSNNIVLYSKNAITVTTDPNFLSSISAFLQNLFGLSSQSPTSTAYSQIQSSKNVDRVYVNVNQQKRISGVIDLDSTDIPIISIEYAGFSVTSPTICDTINKRFSNTPCKADNGKYEIQLTCGTNPAVCDSWLDLTAKLRVS